MKTSVTTRCASAGTPTIALWPVGNPKVVLSGPQASDFAVAVEPSATVPRGGSSTFTVRFDPSAIGVRNATVSIENDSDENPFDFAITGTGVASAQVFKIVEVKLDSKAGDITLRWEGEGPQFQVEKTAAVAGPYQPVGGALSVREFTDSGALNRGAQTFYRVRKQ